MQKLAKNRLMGTSFNHLSKSLDRRNGDLLHTYRYPQLKWRCFLILRSQVTTWNYTEVLRTDLQMTAAFIEKTKLLLKANSTNPCSKVLCRLQISATGKNTRSKQQLQDIENARHNLSRQSTIILLWIPSLCGISERKADALSLLKAGSGMELCSHPVTYRKAKTVRIDDEESEDDVRPDTEPEVQMDTDELKPPDSNADVVKEDITCLERPGSSNSLEFEDQHHSVSQHRMEFDKELFDAEDSDDDKPAEVFKEGGDAVAEELHQLFLLMLQQEVMPQEFKGASIIHLYKRKGNQKACDNHPVNVRIAQASATFGRLHAKVWNRRGIGQPMKPKGAAKKVREQKSRKCKPTKDDMLELHSETQRLLRESHVHLPYHKPGPKSLKDFMERARRKQEVYRSLKGVRDIEKARVIQDQIAEVPPLRLPRLRHPRSSQTQNENAAAASRSHNPHTTELCSQTSCSDSGHVSEGSQGGDTNDDNLTTLASPTPSSRSQVAHLSGIGNAATVDELPDLVSNYSETPDDNGPSQSTSACCVQDPLTKEHPDSHLARDESSQSQTVEEYDSSKDPDSQEIEEMESLPTKDLCSQSAPDIVESFPDSSEAECEVGQEASVCNKANSRQQVTGVRDNTKQTSDESDPDGSPAHAMSDFLTRPDAKDIVQNESDVLHSSPFDVDNTQNEKGAADVKLKSVPRLSKGDGDFIILDEGESTDIHPHSKSKGVQDLMKRLLLQNKKKIPVPPANVEISIVEKEHSEGTQEQLKLKTLTYQMEREDKSDLDLHATTPGGRLQALKQKLEAGMQKRRAEAYERRKQQFEMENEEGFEEGGGDDDLPDEGEEEAELTDAPDTDDSDDEVGDEYDEISLDHCRADARRGGDRKDNPFLDEEAEDSDESWHGGGDDDAHSSAAGDEDLFEEKDTLQLRLDSSDEEDEDAKATRRNSGSRARQLAISDDEEEDVQERTEGVQCPPDTSTPPPATPDEKSKVALADLSYESDGLTPMTRLLQDTQPRYRRTSLPIPMEDSQDLYGGSESDHNSSVVSQTHGSLSDDMSQLLDADGYLRVATLKAKPTRPTLRIQDSQAAEAEDVDDIMGLCSGQFTEGSPAGRKEPEFKGWFGDSQSQEDCGSLSSLFEDSSQSHVAKPSGEASQASMGELLDLCSGRFLSSNNATQCKQSQEKRGVKRRLEVGTDDESGSGPFQILSDDDESRGTEQLSGTDDEQQGYNSDASKENKAFFKAFKKKGKIRKEFVEDEAELSGSEVESDENVDLDEEDDYLELEEGDNDVDMNEEQLRDQVGRVHMKQLMDDDDRDLMRFKEMYLPDGDLHSEGSGRLRRFHWKNMDEGSQQDMFADGSDNEKDGEDADEKQWRMERFEREKFLQEQQGQGQEEGDSQLLQFGKFFMKRQVSEPSVSSVENSTKPKPVPTRSQSVSVTEGSSPAKFIKPKIPKRGSFLARSKESLAKIAEINKPASLNVNGTRGSRNFVFQVLPDKSDNNTSEKAVAEPAAPAPVKAAVHRQPAKKNSLWEGLTPHSQVGDSMLELMSSIGRDNLHNIWMAAQQKYPSAQSHYPSHQHINHHNHGTKGAEPVSSSSQLSDMMWHWIWRLSPDIHIRLMEDADGKRTTETMDSAKSTNLQAFLQQHKFNRSHSHDDELLHNVTRLLAVVETDQLFLMIQPYVEHTLHDILSYSPSLLETCHTKPLFILYQVLQAMAGMHAHGMPVGCVSSNTVLLDSDLWVRMVCPQKLVLVAPAGGLRDPPGDKTSSSQKAELWTGNGQKSSAGSKLISTIKTDSQSVTVGTDSQQSSVQEYSTLLSRKQTVSYTDENENLYLDACQFLKKEKHKMFSLHNLQDVMEMWVLGQLSNFQYLMILNHLAGRRMNDPNNHPVLPWVMDFSSAHDG
ncbi:hypothetical protein BaRGS_00004460 [Batillaria attramentaria]|uniref:BEACH domain-containing protein n=1 Tax=Batillaria attramentaria TaxID=370345 RepID=A0ABD0LY74_9CAEN